MSTNNPGCKTQWFLNLLSNQAKPADLTGSAWFETSFKNHFVTQNQLLGWVNAEKEFKE